MIKLVKTSFACLPSRFLFLLIILVLLPKLLFGQGERPVVVAFQISGKISLDGVLDEGEWARAEAIDELTMVEQRKS